jgi:hypothetical protein
LPSAFWQGDNVCLKFSACFVNVCASTAWLLFGRKWKPSSFACYSYNVIEKFIAIFGHRSKIVCKNRSFLCILLSLVGNFGTHVAQNLWQPILTVIISERTELKFVEIHTKSSDIL